MRTARGLAALAAVLALALASRAPAQGAPDTTAAAPPDTAIARPAAADTSFGGYLESLRDSTDRYFGSTVAPVDTAGLDSALAAGLARGPGGFRYTRRLRFEAAPWLGFNRVDGPIYGGSLALGARRGIGQIGGRAGYAVGADTWLGAGSYRKSFRYRDTDVAFLAEAGRATASVDRERSDLRLAQLRAFLAGNDTRRYFRRDGFETSLDAEYTWWRARAGYRHHLESPLEPTARWSLFSKDLTVPGNLVATLGRNHELTYLIGARTPVLPLVAEAQHWTSSGGIGSDFEYRRSRLSMGGDFAIGQTFAIVPQVSYGRLSGDPLPQAMFYLGGMHSLRSLKGGALGGTGMFLAKLDVLELPDLLEVLRIPHPAMLPIQAGAFVATGAVWGVDPYGGPTRPGVDWPNREDFVHEAGVSLLYRPGIPDPATYMQFSWAWALGPNAPAPRFTLSYTRGLDLVLPFGLGDGP